MNVLNADEIVAGARSDPNSPYRGLIYSIFQLPRETRRGLVIAVISTHPGAGTSHVVRALSTELGHPANHVVRVDLRALANSARPGEDPMYLAKQTWHPSVYEIAPRIQLNGAEEEVSSLWHGSLAHRRDVIEQLAERFEYVLFDCPSISQSGEAMGIVSLVDGILLVAEANRTTKRELRNAEQLIDNAGGKLCGIILNKQKHSVPRWVQRLF